MGRKMIYLDEAIDAIRASTSKYTGFMEMEMYTDDDAVEAIKALPSAQPEQRWIPVSERPPEVDEELESADVLITYKNTYWTGVTTMNIVIARYGEKLLSSDGKYLDTPGWVGSKKYSVDDVLAWMPLSKPYQGENK